MMPHETKLNSVGDILHLNIYDTLYVDEMLVINEEVTEILNQLDRKIILLMDLSSLNAGYSTADQLRRTQEYVHHLQLDSLIVISKNKLNRLISILAFSLARVPSFQFDNKERALLHMTRRGFSGAIDRC